MSLDTSEVNVPNFDCDIDAVGDGPTSADQNIPTGPSTTFQPDLQCCEYQLPTLPFESPPPRLRLPIPLEHSPAHLRNISDVE